VDNHKEKENCTGICHRADPAQQKQIYVLVQCRLIKLAAAEGHPSNIMDMSFASQALAAEYMAKSAKKLVGNVAELNLQSMGVTVVLLTAEQKSI